MLDFDSVTALEQLQVYTSLSDYNLPPYMLNLPLSQCKETLQKAWRTPRISVKQERHKGESKNPPRILSKNILLCPSMHMWKKCLWNNCSLQNISTQKCWNYLSTRKWSVCSCCRTLFWLAGNLCAALPPPLLNLERRKKMEPWPFCLLLAFQSAVHQLQSF